MLFGEVSVSEITRYETIRIHKFKKSEKYWGPRRNGWAGAVLTVQTLSNRGRKAKNFLAFFSIFYTVKILLKNAKKR